MDVQRILKFLQKDLRELKGEGIKVAIEQQKQEATERRKLLEQSGDRLCDLYFESGASTSETTDEQLTDGMDTD